MTSSAQTPEPTDEQRAVAMAAVWPEANRLMWKFATDDDRATCDRVARALAAAVTAEREKVKALMNAAALLDITVAEYMLGTADGGAVTDAQRGMRSVMSEVSR